MKDHPMKTTTMISWALAAMFVAGLSCTDDPEGMDDASDDGAEQMCDPVGPNPQVGALLNAPVADDVEVIVKTPQHPGPAGPDQLP